MNKLDQEESEILEAFESGKRPSRVAEKALAEGIPYQTLVASILHKYVEGRLHENNS